MPVKQTYDIEKTTCGGKLSHAETQRRKEKKNNKTRKEDEPVQQETEVQAHERISSTGLLCCSFRGVALISKKAIDLPECGLGAG